MKVEEYRAVRQGIGVSMIEYTRKAYLQCIVHVIHMCMWRPWSFRKRRAYAFFTMRAGNIRKIVAKVTTVLTVIVLASTLTFVGLAFHDFRIPFQALISWA